MQRKTFFALVAFVSPILAVCALGYHDYKSVAKDVRKGV